MANPTTNYGFVLPTPTDLVTDLPADFDVAMQGVGTQLKALQPGTTLGDLAYSSATANTNTRLPIGTTGQVLAVVGGVPAWATTADQTPLTTKGDLFTFDTADARIGVGANGTVLTANSATGTGLEWATPSPSAMTLIQRSSFSNVANTGTTFDTLFSTSYTSYYVVIESIYAATGADDLHFQFRYAGPTTQATSYFGNDIVTESGTTTITNNAQSNQTQAVIARYTSGSASPSQGQFFVFNASGGSAEPSISATFAEGGGHGQTQSYVQCLVARIYTGFIMKSSSSNITGTVSVYGLRNS